MNRTIGRRASPSRRSGRPSSPLRTAKGRRISSTRWLQRQHRDPFVHRAREEGFRSRSAFKLLEIDERFHLLRPGKPVLDLGAAPGGWCQVAVRAGCAPVVGIDLQPMEPIAGASLHQVDMREEEALAVAAAALGGAPHVVLSDMAAPATGHRSTDRLRVVALAELAADTARRRLGPGGGFVAKVMRAGTPDRLLAELRHCFESVRHFKPQASRPESDEIYIVAMGYRGVATQ